MTTSTPEIPDIEQRVERLRAPLMAELRTAPPAPRRGLRLAAAVTAAAAIAAGAAVLVPGSSNALAVTQRDGVVELRIQDAGASGQELTRELREAGVPGKVEVIAVPDDLVGTWVAVMEAAGRADGGPETVRLDRVEYERRTLRVPVAEVRESTGSFVFYAGRAARPGEPYDFENDRFREGVVTP